MSQAAAEGSAGAAEVEAPAVSSFATSPAPPRSPLEARRAPASLGQASLWLLREIMPCKTPYNTAVGLRLSGEVDAGALVEAVREVARRHESFRTTFAVDDGKVVQVISEAEAADVAVVDVAGAADPAAEAERVAQETARLTFDLSRGPLLRVRLVRIGPRDALLCAVMDHMIADGLSLGVLWREIEALYPALRDGRPSPLPPPKKQFSACVEEQRRWVETPAFAKQLGWWKERLAGAAACDLPTDRPRPPVKSYEGGFVARPIPRGLAGRLRALAGRLDASLFAVLLSGLFALLARASGQRDLALMVPVACRRRFGADEAIGFFSNMIVIRVTVPDRAPFRALVHRVGGEVMAGVLRQDVPFEKVVAALRPDRSLAHDPLARIALSFLPAEGATLSLLNVEASYAEIPNGGAKFDLHVTLAERADGRDGAADLTCIAEYNSDVFDPETMEVLLDRYHRLLEGAAEDPDRAVDDLPLLTPEERSRILVEWNRTESTFPREASLPALVRAAARRTPSAPAAAFEGQEIRYDALCRRAAQIARCLRARGVAPGERVGIALDRSLEMPSALLGILEAGAAYVPLDPAYPKARLAHMADDAGLAALVTERRHRGIFPAPRRGALLVDEDAGEIAAQDDGPLDVAFHPEQVAYVIYTSGSTGKPKGVEVPHRALTSFLSSMARAPGLGPADRLLAVTSLSFDIAGLELWLPLTVGALVEIASRETASSGAALRRVLDVGRITVIQATPSTFRLLFEAGWQPSAGLRVLVGGEAVPRDLVNALARGGASVWNMYGPTETTIWSTIARLDAGEGPVTIGRPIANTQVHVLDAGLEPVPPGVLGELYIGGAGVAHGYLGRPDLTAPRFVPNPFREGERLYRTGDVARFGRDGALELLGRRDHQIKVRGHRIELGEIEAALMEHPSVQRAVAALREDVPGDLRLVAYVVPAAGDAAAAREMRDFLATKLPEYMVPAAVIGLDALPLLPNGKIDRGALPPPGDAHAEGAALVAPRTPVEEVLAGVWADVLGVPRVGVTDDFFALGGHSLMGMRVLARIASALGVELPVRALFEARTVAGLAERCEAARERSAPAHRAAPPIPRAPRDAPLPLSFAQQRLFFLDRIEPHNIAYNLPTALRLSGPLDAAALERCLAEIVGRHEALRTTFAMTADGPRQVIGGAPASPLSVVDLTGVPEPAREGEARRLAEEEAQRPFDLTRGPLFRALLVRLSAEDHVLVLDAHHIVSDGWSEGVLLRELAALYVAFAAGLPSPLPALPVQVADHAAWQRACSTDEALAGPIAHWKEKLGGAPAALDLPADRPRPPRQSYRGTTSPLALSRDLTDALGALARREGATLFMVLLAGFQVLLARYSGQDDIVVGTPVAGRARPEVEGLVGSFINTLALRTDVGGDPTVRDLLARVRETTLDAYAHQGVPFERLVEALDLPRDRSRSPLFQAMLILQNAPPAPEAFGHVRARRIEVERATSKVDLTVWLEETAEGVAGFLEYATALFDAPTIVRMGEHQKLLLAEMAAHPAQRLSALRMLPDDELRTLVATWNDTETEPARDVCVHALVEAQAAARPGATAIACDGRTMAYGELDARAERLARHLIALGAGPGALVGLSMERSIGMVVGLYAILKTGAAYVPLDPTYPRDRIAFVVEDAGMRLLVTEAKVVDRLPAQGIEVVLIDEDGDLAEPAAGSVDGGASAATPHARALDPAYVIYTSGSTGKPKGVQIPHRAVANFLSSMARCPGLGPSDRLLAVTSLSFDIAGLEIWLPLSVGAVVEVASRETTGDGRALRARLDTGEISTIQATPSTFRLLLEAGWAGDGRVKVLVGGEAVPPELADRLLDRAGSVWNVYGPTETTIWSTLHRLEKGAPILIGRPIANTRVHVLDRHLSPVPAGVTGELYIGGEGLARGYLGRPELTAERFVPDPFREGERLYRTGDLARFRRDGALEYLGRADFQIKLRGHRIELGEIEATLARHAAVREAIVLAYEEAPGDQRLAAYVTAKEPGAAPSAAELRAHLRASLPEYMVPGRFIGIDRMPLTQNGKIDRKALPLPDREAAVVEGEAPMDDELTLKLRMVWEEVLRVRGIGLRDSFWDLGGHSLLALRLFDRMEQAVGAKLPVAALFDAPTIGGLAALLRTEGWTPSWACLVPIRTTGGRLPFFCVHAVGGNVLNYRLLARYLGEDQPFYGLQSRGLGGDEAPHDTVEEMARAYVAEIREVQPRGPYRLGGASSGGAIAYEMAQQLVAAGERVAALVMLDTALVGPPPARVSDMLARSPVHGRGVKLDYHVGNLLLRTPRAGAAYLAEKVEARFRGESAPILRAMKNATAVVRGVYEHTLRALDAYVARPYPGNATMLVSCDEPHRTFYDERLLWADLVQGGLVVRFVPGGHETMLDEPHVAGVANVLAQCLG